MPPKKVTGRRKGYKRTATRYRKYVGARRKTLVPRSLTYNVHYFKRTVNGINDGFNTTVDSFTVRRDTSNHYFTFNTNGGGVGAKNYGHLVSTFSIESIPNVSEFTNLFDDYRINKVVMKITPSATIADATLSTASTPAYPMVNPMVHWVIDHDDVTAPTLSEAGLDSLRQYPGYKWRRLIAGRPISIVIKPQTKTSTDQSNNTGLNLNLNKMGAWIDCAHTNVKHYGIKMMFTSVSPTINVNYVIPMDIQTTYYMSYKGVR